MNDLHAAATEAAHRMGELGVSDVVGSDAMLPIAMMVLLLLLALAPLLATPRRR